MAIKPKQILDTAFGLGKAAVSAVDRRLRGGDRATDTAPSTPGTPAATTSGGPTTVGAAGPGKPGGPKAETGATPKAAVEKGKAEPEADKTATPRKRATGRRTAASEAAATSGKEVADAASGKDEQARGDE